MLVDIHNTVWLTGTSASGRVSPRSPRKVGDMGREGGLSLTEVHNQDGAILGDEDRVFFFFFEKKYGCSLQNQ